MNNAKDWLEVLSTTQLFETYDIANTGAVETSGNYNHFRFRRRNSSDIMIWDTDTYHPVQFGKHDGFMSMSGGHTVGDSSAPHAPSPAPAQKADHITMIWTRSNKNLVTLPFDESVGHTPPNDAINVIYDGDQCGTFSIQDIEPHRTDGFPAIIIVGGLRRHYTRGKLHRKGAHAAITAEWIAARWMQNGNHHRTNGPTSVLIENYKEFYAAGEYRGCRFDNIWETWNGDNEPMRDNLTGNTNPLSNRYFSHIQDEMQWMGENGS